MVDGKEYRPEIHLVVKRCFFFKLNLKTYKYNLSSFFYGFWEIQ